MQPNASSRSEVGERASGQFDLKRFMGLARGMGIPADDAARLAMNIVFEQRRSFDLGAGEPTVSRTLE